MLTHARAGHHGAPTEAQPVPYDGSPTGMAAAGILLTPLTVQQNVPNIATAQTAPKTKVNPTHEQGDGRAPGWKWGWMRKNIPYSLATARHKQPRYGPHLRPEAPRGSGHAPGSGPGQAPGQSFQGFRPNMTLAAPRTAYNVAAAQLVISPWGEPNGH